MMVSGGVAVTISALRCRQRAATGGFAVLTAVLLYALVENVIERHDGIAISALFIAGIITVFLVSRISCTTELRAERIKFDDTARRFAADSLAHDGRLYLIAQPWRQRRGQGVPDQGTRPMRQQPRSGRGRRALPRSRRGRPVGVQRRPARHQRRRRRLPGPTRHRAGRPIAIAIAAILLALRDATGVCPTRTSIGPRATPVAHLLRYLLLGCGDTPPVVREITRKVESDPARRPGIHVGG